MCMARLQQASRSCGADSSHGVALAGRTPVDARDRVGSGPVFTFTDTARCKELTNMYYDDKEPIAIGDLKAFAEQTRQLRSTVTAARNNDGRWENKEKL